MLEDESVENDASDLDLSWMLPADRAMLEPVHFGRRGMTFDDIERDRPEAYQSASRALSGSISGDQLRGYDRREQPESPWSENARMLYEEAVQRQWSSATDIPWSEVRPLPDDIERAMCQLCTFLTEVEFIAGDAPAQWLPKISNEDYETKLFLLTQIVDEARHLDVFRKRALANGGGLLAQGQSALSLRLVLDAKDFTEMSAVMHVFAEGFIQSLFRTGELISYNNAEKTIYRLCAQDESRHLGFGVMHLKHVLETQPARREELHHYLDQVEAPLSLDIMHGISSATPYFDQAIAILAGGGLTNFDVGIQRLMGIRRKQVNEYMHRLDVAGLGDRRKRMNPTLRSLLDPAPRRN